MRLQRGRRDFHHFVSNIEHVHIMALDLNDIKLFCKQMKKNVNNCMKTLEQNKVSYLYKSEFQQF